MAGRLVGSKVMGLVELNAFAVGRAKRTAMTEPTAERSSAKTALKFAPPAPSLGYSPRSSTGVPALIPAGRVRPVTSTVKALGVTVAPKV